MSVMTFKVGQSINGFTITRTERPRVGKLMGLWVSCPACGAEHAKRLDRLKKAKSCGCLRKTAPLAERVSKPPAILPDMTKWAPLVASTSEALEADPMILIEMMGALHYRLAEAERYKERFAAKSK